MSSPSLAFHSDGLSQNNLSWRSRTKFGERLRVIIYTGKGGVGKTSTAAAPPFGPRRWGTGRSSWAPDSAHSLADSLDFPLTGEIKTWRRTWTRIEVDVLFEMEHNWKEIGRYVSDFLEAQGMDPVSAKEMTVWPGMELMSALFYLEEFSKNNTYDVVIMDTAPTADTLRLLSFPETSDWYFEKLYKVFRNTIRLARLTVGKFMNTPLPSNEFLDDLDKIRTRMSSVKKILTDPNITSIRLVVNPEKMVINETKRCSPILPLDLPRDAGHKPAHPGRGPELVTHPRSGRNGRSTWN